MAISFDEVRWGMIGCGAVAERKSAPAFDKIAHSRLVAVMGRNPAKAADYAARHGVARWYADTEKLIADPEVNAVYIATPPASHAEYALQALAAGKPVYVEKPMACRYGECLTMNQAAEAAGLPLFVAYYRQALPYFLHVKELLDAGAIGTILAVNISLVQSPRPADRNPDRLPWRVKPEIAGGGYFSIWPAIRWTCWISCSGRSSTLAAIALTAAGFIRRKTPFPRRSASPMAPSAPVLVLRRRRIRPGRPRRNSGQRRRNSVCQLCLYPYRAGKRHRNPPMAAAESGKHPVAPDRSDCRRIARPGPLAVHRRNGGQNPMGDGRYRRTFGLKP